MNLKDFKEEIVGYANQTFSETYNKIYHNLYNNSFHTPSVKPYLHSDIKEGLYEINLPTKANPDSTQYSRIIIKAIPTIDQETAKTLSETLHRNAVKPAGPIDSELIVLVALKRLSFTHGFRHVTPDNGGHLTAIFIQGDKGITTTNELWRKLLQKVIVPFYEKRIRKFLEAHNISVEREDLALTQLYYKGASIIESFDYCRSIFVKGMSHLINWLHTKLVWFQQQFKASVITRQMEKEALKHCTPIPIKLRIQSKRELIAKLQASLNADVELCQVLQNHKVLTEKSLETDDRGLNFEERQILYASLRCRHG